VLRDVALEVPASRRRAIAGPTGTGKRTFVRLVPSARIRMPALDPRRDPAVRNARPAYAHLRAAALEAVVHAGHLVPGAEKAVGLEAARRLDALGHGDAADAEQR
jgi:hypothetical protein